MTKRCFTVLALAAMAMASCAQNSSNAWSAKHSDAPGGRALFLKNCAHCHGADAHGDEGPDLHGLDWTDEQIINRIRTGKKGQMTAFAGKLKTAEIESIVAYLRTLK